MEVRIFVYRKGKTAGRADVKLPGESGVVKVSVNGVEFTINYDKKEVCVYTNSSIGWMNDGIPAVQETSIPDEPGEVSWSAYL